MADRARPSLSHQIDELPFTGCAGVTLSALSLLHAAAGTSQPI
jgi:hypothetical protein